MKARRRTPNPQEAHWAEWMGQAQAGDQQQYQCLLESLLPALRAFVRSRLGDVANVEDVVQNVLLSIHRARHTYRRERPFGPWLWAIARNAVIDAHRARSVRLKREVQLEDVEQIEQPESAGVQEMPLSPRMSRALAELPESQREAVELIHLKGLSVADAAAKVGVSTGALKVRAHRGYRALRKILGGPAA